MRSKALDAMEEAITYSTLGISPDDGETVGTGVALSYKDKKCIVTAKHLVEEMDHNNFRFYFRDDEPQRRITKKELPKIKRLGGRKWFRIPVINITLSDEIDDLALLFIDQSYNLRNLRFHGLLAETYRNAPREHKKSESKILQRKYQSIKNLPTYSVPSDR